MYKPWYIEDLLRTPIPQTSQIDKFQRKGKDQVLIKISGPENDYHYWMKCGWFYTEKFNEHQEIALMKEIQNIPEKYKEEFLLKDVNELKTSNCCIYTDFRTYRTYFIILELNNDHTYQLYIIRNIVI